LTSHWIADQHLVSQSEIAARAGPPAEFETLQFFILALQAVVPDFEGLPDDPPPLEFQVADSEVCAND
jgi:hypothetical protein